MNESGAQKVVGGAHKFPWLGIRKKNREEENEGKKARIDTGKARKKR